LFEVEEKLRRLFERWEVERKSLEEAIEVEEEGEDSLRFKLLLRVVEGEEEEGIASRLLL